VPTTYKELTEEWQQTAAARIVKLALTLTVGWPVRPPPPCRVRSPAAALRRAARSGSAGLATNDWEASKQSCYLSLEGLARADRDRGLNKWHANYLEGSSSREIRARA